jgi:hypothetical protein
MSEAHFHSGEALADRLLQSVKPVLKFRLLHMRKYTTAPMADALALWNPRHGFWKVERGAGAWLGLGRDGSGDHGRRRRVMNSGNDREWPLYRR